MASHSFRDRFFTPPVARAVTSPSGILAFGAGAAAGVLAVGVAPLAIPVAAVGGLLAYGIRVALAIPRRGSAERIDAFGLKEPWRRSVQEAQRARDRFAAAVKTFRAGPLRDTMDTVAAQLDEALAECWRVAKQGQVVADARRQINDREVQWELQQAHAAIGPGGTPNEVQTRTIAALDSQLATAQRMDALVAGTRDQLALLNARLDESVTRAIELSVSNRMGDAEGLGSDVGEIVDDLEALRRAIEDVDGTGRTPSSGPAGAAPVARTELPNPPVAGAQLPPPPRPDIGTGGRSQASPGS